MLKDNAPHAAADEWLGGYFAMSIAIDEPLANAIATLAPQHRDRSATAVFRGESKAERAREAARWLARMAYACDAAGPE